LARFQGVQPSKAISLVISNSSNKLREVKVDMKIAIHNKINYKPLAGDKIAYQSLANDFENVDISINELAKHIGIGHSFCAQHNKKRSTSNFICAEFIAVDIDHGMTLEHALKNDFVRDFSAIVYPTTNHSEQHNRFRIVFALERAIEDAKEMMNAYQGIIRKFGGDQSCKDACRLFFGSSQFEPIVIGKTLPNHMLAEIIQMGKHIPIQAEVSDEGKLITKASVIRSQHSIQDDQLLKTSKGNLALIHELKKGAAVHCPIHIDNHASAFIVHSRKGIKGVHCSRCNETFWSKEIKPSDLWNYDFYSLDGTLREIEYFEDPHNFLDPDAPSEYFSNDDRVVNSSSNQRLTDIKIRPGITLVRSPKGSGKSYQLKKLVEHYKNEGTSVLLIGHRQSLLSALAQELGLVCYLDKVDEYNEVIPVSDHYAICLDSIPRLLDLKINKFKVVIIDESEQVLGHLTSDTLKDQRRNCFLMVERYLKLAEAVIACDADLSYLTLTAISSARNGQMPTQFYVNSHKQTGREIEMYKSERQLLGDLIRNVGEGKKVYVCSNSKTKAEEISQAIASSIQRELKILLITSNNSSSKEIKRFIANIKNEILNYDVVVCSPSMGTGIDITFPDNEQKIDAVYGFFVSRVNTHFDIDQQLCRVRNPKATKVFIPSEKFTFEIEPDVIKRHCIENGKITDVMIGYDDDNNKIYVSDDSLLSVYAEVLSRNRASKNNLLEHFTKLKEYNGWNVKEILLNESDKIFGSDAHNLARKITEEEHIFLICDAEPFLDEEEKHKLIKADSLKKTEQARLDRYFIENFYDEEVTPELIALDNHGKYRKNIRLLEIYLSLDDVLIERDKRESSYALPDRQMFYLRKHLLRELFSSAGLIDTDGVFNLRKKVSASDLDDFKKLCLIRKQQIQQFFDLALRLDFKEKPIGQLNIFLKLIGLQWNSLPQKVDIDGQRIRYYTIDSFTHDLAMKYAQKRADDGLTKHTEFIQQFRSNEQNDVIRDFVSNSRRKSKGH
jgi:hypothetical protein